VHTECDCLRGGVVSRATQGKGSNMTRLIILGGMALAFAAAAGGQAERANAAWPAKCQTMRCVNNHLNNLDRRLRVLRADINFIFSCTDIVRGVTQFGDYASFPDTTVATTGLDWDTSDPQVWLGTVRPRCVDTSARAQSNQFRLYRVR
jgi:hypothetical protein